MKAKRLLSALLAVAMILSLVTVAFAAEMGSLPEAEQVVVTFNFTKMEASEWTENVGTEITEGHTPYWMEVIVNNYGTLTSKPNGSGRKLSNVTMNLTFDKPVNEIFDIAKLKADEILLYDYGVKAAGAGGFDGEQLNMTWAAMSGATAHPTGDVGGLANEDITMMKLPIFAKGSFNINVGAIVEINTYPGSEDRTADTYRTRDGGVKLTNGATMQIGEAATKTYTVTFYEDEAGTKVWGEAQIVEEGEAATAPATNPTKAGFEDDEYTYTYTFKNWDTDFSAVNADLNIKPVFTENKTAKPVVEEPVIDELVEGDKDGVAIIGTDKKYDNAYMTTASFSKLTAIDGAGVLFIPAALLGEADLTHAVTTAADAYKAGGALGDGTLTIKAAIKGIPRALEGRNIEMVTVPYFKANGVYTYGEEARPVINFGDTGEVE